MPPGEPDLGADLAPHQQLITALDLKPDPEVKREIWHPAPFDDEVGVTTDNASEGVW